MLSWWEEKYSAGELQKPKDETKRMFANWLVERQNTDTRTRENFLLPTDLLFSFIKYPDVKPKTYAKTKTRANEKTKDILYAIFSQTKKSCNIWTTN